MHPLDIGPFAVRLIAGFAAAAFLWFVAAEAGAQLARRFLPHSSAWGVLGATFGYAALGSLVAALGAFHAARTGVVVALVAFIALIRMPSYFALLRRAPQHVAAALAWMRGLPLLSRVALGVAAFATISASIAAALPAVWWDPIAYHLPIASAALAHGAFRVDPDMVQSAFPALGEAAALPAYALAGSAGAAMTTLIAGVVLAILCGLLAETLAAGSGLLATALVTSSALWLWLAPSFYVDVPFALFAVGAIAVPILGRMNSTAPAKEMNSTAPAEETSDLSAVAIGALCGALAGAAAAVKYTGLPVAVVALALLLAIGPRQRTLAFGGFAAGAILLAVGWYARNLAVTGDPLFPFLAGALRLPENTISFAGRYIDMTQHWCGGGTGIGDLLVLPWRLLTQPRDFCGDPGYALQLGVIFVLACVVVLRRSWPLALATLALTLFWFESSQQWRFLLPSLAMFGVLAAAGTSVTTERLRALGTGVLLALAVAGIAVNWIPATIAQASSSIVPGFGYIAGAESAPSYLRRRLETFSAAQWLVAQHIEYARVISLDDVRTYYFGGGIAWANPYYQQVWNIDWTTGAGSRYADLARHHYAYLLVNESPPYVHRTPTGVDWDVLRADVAAHALTLVFHDGDVTLYRIEEAP